MAAKRQYPTQTDRRHAFRLRRTKVAPPAVGPRKVLTPASRVITRAVTTGWAGAIPVAAPARGVDRESNSPALAPLLLRGRWRRRADLHRRVERPSAHVLVHF